MPLRFVVLLILIFDSRHCRSSFQQSKRTVRSSCQPAIYIYSYRIYITISSSYSNHCLEYSMYVFACACLVHYKTFVKPSCVYCVRETDEFLLFLWWQENVLLAWRVYLNLHFELHTYIVSEARSQRGKQQLHSLISLSNLRRMRACHRNLLSMCRRGDADRFVRGQSRYRFSPLMAWHDKTFVASLPSVSCCCCCSCCCSFDRYTVSREISCLHHLCQQLSFSWLEGWVVERWRDERTTNNRVVV